MDHAPPVLVGIGHRGHPDKLADQISDAVLDAMLGLDANSRVACETLVTTGVVFVSGEITLNRGYVDIPSIVRDTIRGGRLYGREVRARWLHVRGHHRDPGAVADIAMGVDTRSRSGRSTPTTSSTRSARATRA